MESAKPTVSFAAIVLAMLPAVLDQTILATALPTIAAELGSLSDISWVVTAYVVAAAASAPLWGKLGDRHGRKRLLEISLIAFVGSSALCGAAQDMTQLIVVRLVQGAAAGGLMTLAMAAVGDLVSPRERGRYQGYIAAAFAVATVLGPLAGGLIVDNASWRWVFYVNLPVGIAALAGLALTLPAPDTARPASALDVSGAALLAAATSALMLTCIWGGNRYAWGSAPILALIATTVLLCAALTARERRAADPIVPIGLLRTRAVAVASSALFLATAALFSITVFVPLFLQTTTGATPTEAGLLLVPMMLGITLSTTLSGRSIARSGRYKRFPIAGLALMTTALALLAVFAADPSRTTTGIGLAVFGLGFGLVTQVLLVAVQNSVDRHELGTATATTNFFRALGGAVGAAVLGAVFAARAGVHASQSNIQAIDPVLRADIADAVQTVFLVAAPLAALALIVVLRLPEAPLQTRRAAAHGEGQPGRARAAAGGSQIVLNARRPAMPTYNDLRDERVILLTTFRRDHSPVPTPVNFVLGEGHAYLRTWASSGKSRRIARNPNVTVAPSTYSGKATGPAVPALARALTGEEARQAGKLIDRKYPIIQRLLVPLGHRLRRLTPVIFELMLDETEQSTRRVAR